MHSTTYNSGEPMLAGTIICKRRRSFVGQVLCLALRDHGWKNLRVGYRAGSRTYLQQEVHDHEG